MPDIELQHVVSCSSSDMNHPAENLLKSSGTHKWKSAAAGEKNVSCVLQLSKSSQIHSIDIGNEGCAFIEVLVGKAAAAADQDFEVLLVASSFMSPLESRNGSNRNAVRMFGPNTLNKTTASQKWDRVKVVCTQPFSKTYQYGLSFIKFHSPPGDENEEAKVKKLGAFTIKECSDTEDDIQVGTLFKNRSKTETSPVPVPKGAAAVRAVSRLTEEHLKTISPSTSSTHSPSTTAQKRKASSPEIVSNKVKNLKRDPGPSTNDSDTEEEADVPPKTTLKRQSTSVKSVASLADSSVKPEKSALKHYQTEPSKPSPTKAFSKLMERVTFVLSGFQNPYRGELRDKALEMGAKYRPDWGKGCTHLVCAFDNTPKYKQVAGKGKIVTKGWILDSHKQKKLLPWRKYRLGDADSPDESSDDEEEQRPGRKMLIKRKSPASQSQTSSKGCKTTTHKGVTFSDESDSGGDTEDEIRKVQERADKKKAQTSSTASENSKPLQKKGAADSGASYYDASTDEDEVPLSDINAAPKTDEGSDSGLPDFPEFFTDKYFFFYGDFEASKRRLLTRYIAAYNGEVEDYMSKKVNFVVTQQKWDDNFEEAINENPNLIFVKPNWIFMCNKKNKLVPHQAYVVVPQ